MNANSGNSANRTAAEALEANIEAARAIDIDPAYLLRLRRGEKTAPSPIVLRKLGLRRVTKYERYP